jgi:GH15 family glucan-1,4-alpha-glucosidase
MNFLVLDALQHYALTTGPFQKEAQRIHSLLRVNLVQVGPSLRPPERIYKMLQFWLRHLLCEPSAAGSRCTGSRAAAALQNMVSEYRGRGYLYEQYDDGNGRGMSSHPFTGWSALLALIAAGAY